MRYTVTCSQSPENYQPLHIVNPHQEFVVFCDPSGTWDDGPKGSILALELLQTALTSHAILSVRQILEIVETVRHTVTARISNETAPFEGVTFSLILTSLVNNSAAIIHAAIFQIGLIRDGMVVAQTYTPTIRDKFIETQGFEPPENTPTAFLGPVFGPCEALIEPPRELQPNDRLVIAYRRVWDHWTDADLAVISSAPNDQALADWVQTLEYPNGKLGYLRRCIIVSDVTAQHTEPSHPPRSAVDLRDCAQT